jgi:hypothetical protein
MFRRPGDDHTPVNKVAFVTHVGGLGCAVCCYRWDSGLDDEPESDGPWYSAAVEFQQCEEGTRREQLRPIQTGFGYFLF